MTERKPGFKCPQCGEPFYVKNGRHKSPTLFVRYRECKACGNKDVTIEKIRNQTKNAIYGTQVEKVSCQKNLFQ